MYVFLNQRELFCSNTIKNVLVTNENKSTSCMFSEYFRFPELVNILIITRSYRTMKK